VIIRQLQSSSKDVLILNVSERDDLVDPIPKGGPGDQPHGEVLGVPSLADYENLVRFKHAEVGGICTMDVRYVLMDLHSLVPICRSVVSWLATGENDPNPKRKPNMVVFNCPLVFAPIIVGAALIECERTLPLGKIKSCIKQVCDQLNQFEKTNRFTLLPSQKRFLLDYYNLVKTPTPSFHDQLSQKIELTQIRLINAPKFSSDAKYGMFYMIFRGNDVIANSLVIDRGVKYVKQTDPEIVFYLKQPLSGDFALNFYYRPSEGPPRKVLVVPTNTSFLGSNPTKFEKKDLDGPSQDPNFSVDFQVLFSFNVIQPEVIETETSREKTAEEISLEDERLARNLQETFDREAREASGGFLESVDGSELTAQSLPEPAFDEQLLADDALARQLQQEFYNEVATSVTRYGSAGIPFSKISLLPTSQYKCPSNSFSSSNSNHNPKSKSKFEASDKSPQSDLECQICRVAFEEGESIRTLPCFHFYHMDCIDSWLVYKAVCPVCLTKIDSFIQEEEQGSLS